MSTLGIVLRCICFMVGLLLATPARADLTSALARFAEDSFSETALAIDEIAASGAPNAAVIIEALADRRLFVDPATKAVFYKDATGKLLAAATGKPLPAEPADPQLVRVNNRLRGAIDAALGSLTLLSPDPAKRIQAADSVFKTRDPKSLAAIDTALGKETDTAARRSFTRARAAILLEDPGTALKDQIAAIKDLSSWADQDTLGPNLDASAVGELQCSPLHELDRRTGNGLVDRGHGAHGAVVSMLTMSRIRVASAGPDDTGRAP